MTNTADRTELAENLQLQAYERLRSAILYAEHAPGSKLMAKDLCAQLNMGRTPVREALVRLRQEGLVHVVPQSGTYVSLISLNAVESARYVRENLERNIVVECCAQATPDDRERLAEVIREQEQALESRDNRAFFDGDNRLHRMFYQICGREQVWRWLESLSIDLNRYRWLRLQTDVLDWETLMDQHRRICDAILERSASEASYLITNHLHLLFAEKSSVTERFPKYFVNDRARDSR